MSEFTIHTLDTAPKASRQILQNTEKQLGFVPNLFGALPTIVSPLLFPMNGMMTLDNDTVLKAMSCGNLLIIV